MKYIMIPTEKEATVYDEDKKCYIEVRLFRIRATKDFEDVKIGDFGGFVQNESNLSQEGDCWIYDEAREFMMESKLKRNVDEMADYLKDKAVNDNIKRFIPTTSDFIDNKMIAEILMKIAPIVELDVDDKITKEIKALSRKYSGQREVINLMYETLLDGYYYTAHILNIFIDDEDTVTSIYTTSFDGHQ